MAVIFCDDDFPLGADAWVDDRNMNGAVREILIGAVDPETGLRRPVGWNVVRQIDNRRILEAAQDDSLHYTGKRAFVAEVGCYRYDAGWLPVAHEDL